MCVYSRILRLIIVEADSLSLRSSKDWTTMSKNLGLNSIQCHLLFRSNLCKSRHELLIVDLAGRSFLVPSKDEVDVCGAALLVCETTLLRQLGKSLAVHFSTVSVCTEDLLEA